MSEIKKYSDKIKVPVYEPKNKQPKLRELHKIEKYKELCENINNSGVSDEEKEFLRLAAARHIKFSYSKVADYYAHATPEMQQLMEDSAMVIIDLGSAVRNGYVRVCEQIRQQYLEEYGNDQ
jgi:hypothetical protein